jgi:predicted aspartyl protease
MFENIDTSTAIALVGFFVTIAMQLIGFGKIIGSVNVRLSVQDEQHIRHQTRIDEHARLISDHDRDLAVLIDRRKREGNDE